MLPPLSPDLKEKAWKEIFFEKPLSLIDFAKSYTSYEYLYPHIKKELENLSGISFYKIFMQTPIGSGKSSLLSIIMLYRIYLFCLLKDPNSTFGLSPTCKFSFGILGTRKTSVLALNGLTQIIENLPIFSKVQSKLDDNPGKICYSFNQYDALMEFYYVSPNGSRGAPLKLIPIQRSADLLGAQLIGAAFSEILSFMADTGISSYEMFDLIQKTIRRVDARLGESPLKLIIIEKEPFDIEKDCLDEYIWSSAIHDPEDKFIRFRPLWELFPDKYDMTHKAYFNIASEKVREFTENETILIDENTFIIPASLVKLAKESPQAFMRDYLGLPTSIVTKPEVKELKDLYNRLLLANTKIILKAGKFYLVSKDNKAELDIHDLFC